MQEPFWLFLILFALGLANVFFPPVPLESATLFAGFMSGAGRGSLAVAIAGSVLGMTAGGILLYLLVDRRGLSVLTRLMPGRPLPQAAIDRAAAWFNRYGLWTLFAGKLVPGLSLCAVVACGVLHYRPARAIPAIAGSNLLFFSALAVLGRVLGDRWAQAAAVLGRYGTVSLVVVGVLVVGGYVVLRRKIGGG